MFEQRQYFFTLQISTWPAILPLPLSQLPNRLHLLLPPSYGRQDICLGVIRQNAMRYGKIRFIWEGSNSYTGQYGQCRLY